jgi:ubiquinone/menaquinone biosynthesis C-methylase UbiE
MPASVPIPDRARPAVVATFDRIARFYDTAILQRIAYRPNHDAVVSELRRAGARRVLDVGCGTGILATRIWRELRPELVYACDPSPGMLEQARERSGDIRWLRGSAEQIPLDDGALDAIVTTEAFQFFDQPAALNEFSRLLEPRGIVVIAMLTAPVPALSVLTRLAPAKWPTRGQLRRMLENAGLDVCRQRPVRPILGPLSPGFATVAVRR